MKIAIPKERAAGESRVAASIEVIGKLVGLGCDFVIEASAGDTRAWGAHSHEGKRTPCQRGGRYGDFYW